MDEVSVYTHWNLKYSNIKGRCQAFRSFFKSFWWISVYPKSPREKKIEHRNWDSYETSDPVVLLAAMRFRQKKNSKFHKVDEAKAPRVHSFKIIRNCSGNFNLKSETKFPKRRKLGLSMAHVPSKIHHHPPDFRCNQFRVASTRSITQCHSCTPYVVRGTRFGTFTHACRHPMNEHRSKISTFRQANVKTKFTPTFLQCLTALHYIYIYMPQCDAPTHNSSTTTLS